MIRSLLVATLFATLVFASPVGATPKPGATWNWQLVGKVEVPKGVRAFDAEPDGLSKARVHKMNKNKTFTICYVSVGTVENWRGDVHLFPSWVVGRTYGDWPNEKFLDIRQLDVLLPIMTARFQRCKNKGFKAIEPDNMDVHSNMSGFPIGRADTVRYVKALANIAHEMGLKIGQKNVPELTKQLVGTMDFAITESCFQDRWCAKMKPYTKRGKPVFDAEYTDRKVDFQVACRKAKKLKISMIFKRRNLGAWMRPCK